MAKALIGHLQQDRGLPARLAAENAQLRVRVAELEALVTRLMEENDRLAVAAGRARARPRARAAGDAARLSGLTHHPPPRRRLRRPA